MERYNFYSRILATGAPAPSSTVDVFDVGTLNPSAIFSDDGITPKANPFTTDANGFGFFYAADGDYDVRNSGGGIVTPYTWGDITLGPGVSGAHTWTGVQTFSTPIAVASGGTGLNASTVTDGQLLIGNDGANNFTLAGLTGTANQVVVTPGAGSITLSLPQSIAAASSPTFTDLTLSGGLVVGFAGAVVADQVQVGDANFIADFNAGDPQLVFDANDAIRYTRATNTLDFRIGATVEATITAAGLQVTNGLNVGFAGAPADDILAVGDANFHLDGSGGLASPRITFDAGSDWLLFTRATNTFAFQIGGNSEVLITTAGMQIPDGLVVGFSAAPAADQIQLGDANFALDLNAGAPQITFDTGTDALRYDRTSNFWQFLVANTQEARIDASGVQIANGLVVGFAGTPGDDEIRLGDANFGLQLTSPTSATLRFDTGDTLAYDRTNNILTTTFNAVPVLTIDAGVAPITYTWSDAAALSSFQFPNTGLLRWMNAAGTLYLTALEVTAGNNVRIGAGTTDIQWGRAVVAMGGGAAPTLGTIGGAGPAVAGQNTWVRVLDSAGVAMFIPAWR